MSEASRELLIRLPVDQEVYAEQAASGEWCKMRPSRRRSSRSITTVIRISSRARSCLRPMSRSRRAAMWCMCTSASRLLRVPVSAQQAAVLNVKSRLSSVQMEVSGDAWLHLTGWLRCTAQRLEGISVSLRGSGGAGDFFSRRWQRRECGDPVQPAVDPAFEPAFAMRAGGGSGDEGWSRARGGGGERGARRGRARAGVAERGGAEPASVTDDLAAFDRFLPETGSAGVVCATDELRVRESRSRRVVAARPWRRSVRPPHGRSGRGGGRGSRRRRRLKKRFRSPKPPNSSPSSRRGGRPSGRPEAAMRFATAPDSFFASSRDGERDRHKPEIRRRTGVGRERWRAPRRGCEATRGEAPSKPKNKKLWSSSTSNTRSRATRFGSVIVSKTRRSKRWAECGALHAEASSSARIRGPGSARNGDGAFVPERRLTIQKVVTSTEGTGETSKDRTAGIDWPWLVVPDVSWRCAPSGSAGNMRKKTRNKSMRMSRSSALARKMARKKSSRMASARSNLTNRSKF